MQLNTLMVLCIRMCLLRVIKQLLQRHSVGSIEIIDDRVKCLRIHRFKVAGEEMIIQTPQDGEEISKS